MQAGTIAIRRPGWRTRDYYRIEDVHGAQYWVYRAGLYGTGEGPAGDEEVADMTRCQGVGEQPLWFLHGVF